MYGLKQASRLWNIKLTDALLKVGFIQSNYDYSLFTKKENGHTVIILIYVDDLLITGSCKNLIGQGKEALHKQFKVKDFGDLKYFLGIEVLRSDCGILLNKRKYVLELISELGLSGAKPSPTPLETNVRLTTTQFDKETRRQGDRLLTDVSAYQRLMGKL